MQLPKRCLGFISSFLCILVAAASAMDNAGVIKLKQAGLSDDTILLAIKKEPGQYDTRSEALVALKDAGISDALIQEIVARSAAKDGPASEAKSTAEESATNLFSVQSPSIAPPSVEVAIGKDYFTRFSFHQEGGEYPITNYGRGLLVPINTPVKLIKMTGKKITLKRLDNSEEIKVENIPEYSGKKNLPDVARLLLSAEPTPIDKLAPELASSIRAGEMRKGMTKEQVLMARGYPPAHETPSIEGDRWVYWSSRFIKQTIVFTNGRLTEGRGIL